MSTTQTRPWYALDALVDDYATVVGRGSELTMIKRLKLVRSIVVIVGVSAISLYALFLGANPTLVAVLSLPSLATYAGVEAIDYGALLQAYKEAQQPEEE